MDLSRLPEPLRSRLAEQLERLPPEVRATLEQQLAKVPAAQLEGVLKKMAPMVERLAAKSGATGAGHGHAGGKSAGGKSVGASKSSVVAGASGAVQSASTHRAYDPHDHYNNTVKRGDRDSPPLFVIMFLVACAAVFLQTIGFFHTPG